MVNPNQGLPEGSKQAFEQQNKETIAQLYNYPSITTWVLFNEKWGQYDQARLTSEIKKADPARLVNGHSGEYLYVNNQLRSPSPDAYINADMTDVHSYPNPMISEKQAGKARVLGEFGGIGVPIENHLWDDTKAGWGYDGIVTPQKMKTQYSQMMDSLVKLKEQGLSGSIYTQPFDVETEQNGIMTYDREIIKLKPEDLRTIHAKLQPVTANYLSATKGFTARVTEAIVKSYQERLAEYKAGKREESFLRSLALMALASNDKAFAQEVANEFITKINDPFKESNLKFIRKFTSSSEDPGFRILYKNSGKVDKVLGEDEAGSRVRAIIAKEEILPFEKEGNPDWGKIQSKILSKYPEVGEEVILQARVFYAVNYEKWADLKTYLTPWYTKYGYKRKSIGSIIINTIAWRTFKNINDIISLQTALSMTTKVVDADMDANLIDTHANLLYRLGRRDEAIVWEEKAVRLSNNRREAVETLEKMKKNIPTWDESKQVR